jgi:hypothetical protein
MRFAPLLLCLPLAGCGGAGLPLAAAALGYIASVNNLGGDYLKFRTEAKACPVTDPTIQPTPFVTTLTAATATQSQSEPPHE